MRRLTLITASLVLAACAGSDEQAGTGDDEPEAAVEIEVPDAGLFSENSVVEATSTSLATTTTTTTVPATTTSSSTSSTTTTTSTTTTMPATTSTSVAPTTLPLPAVSPCPPTGSQVWVNRPASDLAPPALPEGWREDTAGTSVAGRDLTVLVREVDDPARTVVVIGGIHGNEPASPPSVRAMVTASIPADTEVWLLPLLNPDGSAAGTRCNANGVDLNRNFSWDWRASTGGPAPFSEPEPQAARALVERVAPDLVVWVHQPLAYVSSIGDTPDSYEQAWSAGSGLPVRPDVTQHGGGESWTAFEAGVPSMLIEIASWEARQDMVDDQVRGFEALLEVVVPR